MTRSVAEMLAAHPPDVREKVLRELGDANVEALTWDWRGFWARPNQVAPEGDWDIWLILAGRGFGKTRTGAEWIKEEVMAGRATRIALLAETQKDLEEVMVFGNSGIASVFPPDKQPKIVRKPIRIEFHNGAQAFGYNGTEPDQLRGPQFDCAWADELAKFRYAQEAWDQLQFGLRLGSKPRVCVTTTPRPIPIIRELVKRAGVEGVVVTRGSTLENRGNLAASFRKAVVDRYAGTRLGRQELDAELLDDAPGALWTRRMIDDARRVEAQVPEIGRIVVAVDPAVTSGEEADENGIIVAGVGVDQRAYVLDDASMRGGPAEWAKRAVSMMDRHEADGVVVEVNQGGEMVAATLRSVRPKLKIIEVRASRGKHVRAEPIAALYEQGRVSHVGAFATLEDQMCVVAGTKIETARGLVPIERVRRGDLVMTRKGFAPVKTAGRTGTSTVIMVLCTATGTIEVTPCHPIFDPTRQQFVSAGSALPSDRLLARLSMGSTERRSHGEGAGITECRAGTFAMRRASSSIARFGRRIADPFRRVISSITATRTLATIGWRTLSPSILGGTQTFTSTGTENTTSTRASCAGAPSSPDGRSIPATVATHVLSVRAEQRVEPVYNLEVEAGHLPEYFANGILVHNCLMTAQGYLGDRSPDRLDALVWALTELFPAVIKPPRKEEPAPRRAMPGPDAGRWMAR